MSPWLQQVIEIMRRSNWSGQLDECRISGWRSNHITVDSRVPMSSVVLDLFCHLMLLNILINLKSLVWIHSLIIKFGPKDGKNSTCIFSDIFGWDWSTRQRHVKRQLFFTNAGSSKLLTWPIEESSPRSSANCETTRNDISLIRGDIMKWSPFYRNSEMVNMVLVLYIIYLVYKTTPCMGETVPNTYSSTILSRYVCYYGIVEITCCLSRITRNQFIGSTFCFLPKTSKYCNWWLQLLCFCFRH